MTNLNSNQLRFLYEVIFEEPYDSCNEIALFNVVYLLSRKGVIETNFKLLSSGLYNSALINAIEGIGYDRKPINLSDSATKAIKEIQMMLKGRSIYNINNWSKALSVAHYLKEYVVSGTDSDNLIITTMERYGLYNKNENRRALSTIYSYEETPNINDNKNTSNECIAQFKERAAKFDEELAELNKKLDELTVAVKNLSKTIDHIVNE